MRDAFEDFKRGVMKAISDQGEPFRPPSGTDMESPRDRDARENSNLLLKKHKDLPWEYWDFCKALASMRSAVEIGTKEDIANASIALAWHSLNLGAFVKWKHHKEGQSRGGGAEKAAWHDYVRQQVADFYTISPRKPATEITTSIMKNAPLEIDLPEHDAVYEFVREVRKGLKQSPAQK